MSRFIASTNLSSSLPGLLPQLSIRDARPRHELHELERELISDELVMRESMGGR
jgi:hypothetical protein